MHSKNQKRHGSPVPSRSPLVPMKPKAPAVAPAVAPSPGGTLAFRVPKDYPHSRFSKAPLAVYPPKGARNKTCVSLPVVSLEKMPCLSRADSASHVRLTSSSPSSSSSPSPLKPASLTSPGSQRSSEKITNGRGTSGPSTPHSTTPPSSLDRRPSPARSPLDRRPSSTPSPSPLDRKPSPSPSPSQRSVTLPSSLSSSPLEKKHQNGTKTSSRSYRRLSGRVFDPNKHCGVPDPETKQPCTRSLTCKTHSLSHRRAVPGRRKHFDILLAEHKGRAKEKEGAKEKDKDGAQGEKEGCSQSITSQESPSKPHCPNGRPLSTLKLRLANAHIPRVPGSSTTSTSSPLPPAPVPATAPNPESSPHSWLTAAGDGGQFSSDEADGETPEDTERPAFHYSNHHPQPIGFCVFGSRLMGRGHYVFDRRWDKMRLVLQSMVEKHLNAQMWRKVPLAAESLLSLSSSASSPVTSLQQTPSPTSTTSPLLSSPSNSYSYTATFPQSASTAGVFSIRDAPQPLAPLLGKARNGAHKVSRPSKDIQDYVVGSKKRKNSSSSPSSSSLFSTVDNHKRNGSSCHSTFQGSGGTAPSPAKKKGLGGSGLWHSADDWLSRSDVSQSHSSHNSRDIGTTGIAHSPNREPASSSSHHLLAPPSGPLAYVGGAEGRKRRSPSSYRGKASKLSRSGGLESLFGNGSDSGGLLSLGPESSRQAKLHH
ncbi:ataxin-7-like protein 1 isoform X1 [Anabas testudineus]|uniref:SCA7 domain-containing protein n=1 Tax=Anabas testudineus TaxID=64144 RepID=A0A3Q1JU29_ANATE|nr:ataxin-7-like protein 1 isoform X1 [Anabas testudineus]